MTGFMIAVILYLVWPFILPMLFLFTYREQIQPRGFFYLIGLLVCFGSNLIAPVIWGGLVGLFGGIWALTHDNNFDAVFRFAVPGLDQGTFLYSIILYIGTGMLLSIALLKGMLRRFYVTEDGQTVRSTDEG